MTPRTIRLGTRGSRLALWQTEHVAGLLRAAWPNVQTEVVVFSTEGDRRLDTPLPLLGGKGAFTAELELALAQRRIDLAVHSLKDLPTEEQPGLVIGAVLKRDAPNDVLITRSGLLLEALPPDSVIGTSSRRRAAQLLHAYPSLRVTDIRGNVDTRLRKALDPSGPYDGVLFAEAGLERLGLLKTALPPNCRPQELDLDVMLPAPGQGAIAAQCRSEDEILSLLQPLDHGGTRAAVTAERSFLRGLGAGCATPVAGYAIFKEGILHLKGRVMSADGRHVVEVVGSAPHADAEGLGQRAAAEALARGARDLLESSHD